MAMSVDDCRQMTNWKVFGRNGERKEERKVLPGIYQKTEENHASTQRRRVLTEMIAGHILNTSPEHRGYTNLLCRRVKK